MREKKAVVSESKLTAKVSREKSKEQEKPRLFRGRKYPETLKEAHTAQLRH